MQNDPSDGGVPDIFSGRSSRRGDRTAAVKQPVSVEKETFFSRIKEGRVIPVISNSFSYDAIFARMVEDTAAAIAAANEANKGKPCGQLPMKLNGENILAQGWARSEAVNYPFPDNYELARVAQYNRWKKIFDEAKKDYVDKEDETAKREFFSFLKLTLINYGDYLEEDINTLNELEAGMGNLDFEDMAARLDLPRYEKIEQDPLRILASFPLPIYITTSPHMFLERALIDEEKEPVTQVCFWPEQVKTNTSGVSLDFATPPTPTQPVVFHLFGLDRNLPTMVLTEDDYLNVLVRISKDASDELIIPPLVRSAFSFSSLLLVGYRLQDWDFRVLFRGLIAPHKKTGDMKNLILQLDPDQQYNAKDANEARNYLKTYFQSGQIGVEWVKTDDYLITLRQEYSEWVKTHQ